MAYVIAFAGKGGTGKTSLAALTVRYIRDRKKKAVLAVDADANACLNEALGLDVHETIGGLREESLKAVRAGKERPGGMTTEQLFDYQVQKSVIESDGVDLIVMGRPEGPGCYCAANNIIRKYTDILADDYEYVVIDNEAGMEHLSRRTTHAVDLLLIVSDATVKGVKTIKRIDGLVDELELDVKQRKFIINRIPGDAEKIVEFASSVGLEIDATIAQDDNIAEFDMEGKAVCDLPEDSEALKSLFAMLDEVPIP